MKYEAVVRSVIMGRVDRPCMSAVIKQMPTFILYSLYNAKDQDEHLLIKADRTCLITIMFSLIHITVLHNVDGLIPAVINCALRSIDT